MNYKKRQKIPNPINHQDNTELCRKKYRPLFVSVKKFPKCLMDHAMLKYKDKDKDRRHNRSEDQENVV